MENKWKVVDAFNGAVIDYCTTKAQGERIAQREAHEIHSHEDMAKPTNGIGTANKENVQNSNMHKFLREMAQTRALGRALRSYTGYGSTTYEELPDATVVVD